MTPGNITASNFSSSYQVFHFPHGIYNFTTPVNFGDGIEIYLDDGAILKYTGSAANAGPMISRGGWPHPAYNAVVRGWGILDGQAAEAHLSNGSPSVACAANQQQTAPMCQPPGTGTLADCGGNTSILAFSDLTTGASLQAMVDGAVFRNSCTWTFQMAKDVGTATYPVVVNNIKMLNFSGGNTTGESNSDGIDVMTDQYLNITSSFFRTVDDAVTIKQLTGSDTTLGVWPATNNQRRRKHVLERVCARDGGWW